MFRLISILLFLVFSLQSQSLQNNKNEFGLILINDTLFKTDKDYTGSVGAYYKFSTIPLILKYQIDAYTPSTEHRDQREPPQNSHPYAGFGFIGAEYKALYNQFLFTVNLEIGATGKYSYAQELQDGLHNLINDKLFKGWDSQIQTRFGYVFNPKVECILFTEYFTLLPILNVKLGNLLSTQTIGIQLLTGFNYNRDLLIKKYSNKPNYNITIAYELSNISKNVFLSGFDGYEYGVEKINTISELKLGFEIQYKTFGIKFQNQYQSKEYKKQENANKFSVLVLYLLF